MTAIAAAGAGKPPGDNGNYGKKKPEPTKVIKTNIS